MDNNLSNEELGHLSDFIVERMGLYFSPANWADLRRGFARVAREMGFGDCSSCARALMGGALTRRQVEVLAGHLTVGETFFFRESRSFEVLADEILPGLIQERAEGERRLRIWSAGCCTGEEAYSIAAVLRQVVPDVDQWNITILATDINPHFLRKAAAGIYGGWSFRDTPARFKNHICRERGGGHFEVLPELRRMVEFMPLNLAEDIYPALENGTNAMDVIFCRNVLMYFTAAQAKRVMEKFCRAQVAGGWLCVSPTELPLVSISGYETVHFEGVILHQKGSRRAKPERERAFIAEIESPMAVEARKPASGVMPGAPVVEVIYVPEQVKAKPALPAEPGALYGQGRYEEAAEALEALVVDRPGESASLSLLARSLANQGKLGEALACCNEWIGVDKLNSASHYLRAVILQEQGLAEEAVQSLRRALYLDPGFVVAHFAMGNVARSRNNIAEAEKHLNNALRLLEGHGAEEVVPESEGMTAGRFKEIINSLIRVEAAA